MSSTVGRNSLIMASGTIASRVTGQLRTIALVGALGTTGVAANAYQAGAQIPQVIFNLISTGIFNAVLVPQIVRTLKEKDAEERLSKLITMAMVMLAIITAIMMAGTPVLTSIYVGSGWTPAQRALANAFTLWCMPQIFFYGLYTIIGQILAASGRFAAYAWSSVGANAISCVGFGAFILLFGNAARQPMDFWTTGRIALTAGAWTAGVAFQALVLFIPLLRVGLRYRVRFGLRGLGLRSMGKVAAWSIAMVVVNQLMGIVNSRVTTGAPAAGGDLFGIAGNASYQYAYTLYILPYSVVAASIATAMFPRLSKAVGERRVDHARAELSSALRTNGLVMVFFVAAMMAMPVAVTKALIPSTSLHGALLIAGPLMGLLIGLVPISAFLFVQRAFYAWEDGRSPFLFALVENLVQVALLLVLMQVLPPQHWTTLVGVSLSLSYIVTFPWVIWMLRRRFGGRMDGRRILGTYLRCLVAGVGAWAVGWLVNPLATRLVGADIASADGRLGWGQSLVICCVVGVAVAAAYAALLWLLRVDEFTSLVRGVTRRLRGSRRSADGMVS
ncbi:murein biosynthesis integral membrane protein MurJ [Bifidobacterium pullorum]|uniref:murein biosynthesis integral membrane protein MurJ n=1 Tax=Bifidobacterium pullorum TaxID=78448 RepID=UPI001EF56729|nr:lipid II flippase MurJ [Bifidobacterium pullorum]